MSDTAMTKKLRFAPLIRVSTESQEKRGESLKVQKQQIEEYVRILNGTIHKACWKYSGQEHATVDQERAKLDALLEDSGKDIFDAIICCDASRWSRDNRKSKEGLETLRKNGIRFFVGTTEYDLFNPEQTFFLSLAVEIGEFHANQQALKSIVSRIERAKRGIPTAGKLPYGRTFDKATGKWGIDEDKKHKIERIAREYLDGAKAEKLAKKNGMNYPNLLKILKHRSGNKWEIRIRSKKLNIDETVVIKIPRLLPDDVIKAIHQRARANKTYTKGETKYPYPLSSLIFCGHCGYVMFGQVNHLKKRYYRHPRGRNHGCDLFNYIPAEIIEDSVLFNLFHLFGDQGKMEQAAKDAIPNFEQIQDMKTQIISDQEELKKINRKKEKLIDAIEDSGMDQNIKTRLQKHKEREALLKEEITDLSSRISEFPSEEEISMRSELIQRTMESYYRGPEHLKNMTMNDKKTFFQSIFGGMDRDGNRYGVRVYQYEKDGKKKWEFKLIGNLITPGINDVFYPLFKGEKEAIADVPDGFFDDEWEEEQDNKQGNCGNLDSQCHAYYGIGLYQRR